MSTPKPVKNITATGNSIAYNRLNDSNRSKNASISRSRIGNRNPTLASQHSHLASAGKKQTTGVGGDRSSVVKMPITILDEAGNDVTPLPLLHVDPNLVKKTQASVLADSSVGTPTDLMSQASASIYGTQAGTGTSVFGGGPFTRSVFTQSYDTASDSLPLDEPGAPETTTFAEVRHKRQEVQELPTEEDLGKIVDIILTETDTIWMLDMPDVKVSIESEEAEDVKNSIRVYTELQRSRVGNDLYVERGMNTFNEAPKLKSVQTLKIEMQDVDAECTNWDMFDTFDAFEAEQEDDEDVQEEGTISRPESPEDDESLKTVDPVAVESNIKKESNIILQSTSRSGSVIQQSGSKRSSFEMKDSKNTITSSSMMGSEIQTSLDMVLEITEKEKLSQEWENLAKTDEFMNHLFTLERVINLNTYQAKQAQYRGFQSLTGLLSAQSSLPEQDVGPNLDRLWSYGCNLTRGKNVSCMTWNKANKDLVAVGYGQFEFTNQKPGLVCCWCIKNPEYPERIFTSKQGVTALHFSTTNPNLLAVGYYDGSIAVYNVRKSADEPVLDNFTTAGKHLAPVWQLKWIHKERGAGDERSEVLMSISSDGRVCQWSIRKGFESYDVMKLKKMPTRIAGKTREKKGEAFISRFAGGMCFDFHAEDSNMYLAGTEEGYIHKCSCSHNEQYLESYQGHMGPVYSVQWSPFDPDIFLSCSADWTVKLWHQDRTRPVLSFHSSTKAVNGICWSPWSSTVFVCVNEGAVEIWNLAASTLDAVYSLSSMTGTKHTCVAFSENSQCLLVGDSEGLVTVYELRHMPNVKPDQQDQALRDVIKASLANQMPGPTDGAGDQQDQDVEGEEGPPATSHD